MSYAEAWREDRRHWRWLLLWAIGLPVGFTLFVLGLGGLYLLLEHLFPPPRAEWLWALLHQVPSPDALSLVVMVLWGAGCVLLSFKVFTFACPRCGESFYTKGFTGNSFTSECMHCGLRKGAVEPLAGSDRGQLRPPIFIKGKELRAFDSVEDAERYLKPVKVWADEGFDSTGLRLHLEVWKQRGLLGWTVERVRLGPGEHQPSGQARLRQLLSGYLEGLGNPREWIQRLSYEELVREVAALTLTRVR